MITTQLIHRVTDSFLGIKTFKIYSHSNSQIHRTALLATVTALRVTSPGPVCLLTGICTFGPFLPTIICVSSKWRESDFQKSQLLGREGRDG